MILTDSRYVIRSQNSNRIYWEQGMYPDWTRISAFQSIPGQKQGAGVEPHYHDNDEIWLFLSGHGEVWLDGQSMPITPNTAIYTPMGVVHRFQMFTEFDNVAIVTPLERQKRATHVLVERDGPPQRTVAGFIIPGAENTGPFDPGPRCPLSELRPVKLGAGQTLDTEVLATNEHWIVLEGIVQLQVDDLEIELDVHDLALLRAGAQRRLHAASGARLVLAREVAHVS